MALTSPLIRDLESRDSVLQLRDAASSVASNYRVANRAKSHRDFTSKIGTVLEEAEESLHWLEFVRDCRFVAQEPVKPLVAEARELVAIFTTANQTARRRDREPPPRRHQCRRKH